MKKYKSIPKEVSWLSFNARVLQEAANKDVPIGNRMKFLGIYSSNLDEYFRVRVATLKRLSKIGAKAKDYIGFNPTDVIKEINDISLKDAKRFEKIYKGIIQDLSELGIYLLNEKELNKKQKDFALNYFNNTVRPKLMPIMINESTKLPDFVDDSIYFGIHLIRKNKKDMYVVLKLPTDELDRFILLPSKEKAIIYLDDIIRLGLNDLFGAFKPKEIEAYTYKVTKDAELDLTDDLSESYIDQMSKSIEQRKSNYPVRFVHDRNMPEDLKEELIKLYNVKPYDVFTPGGRYHNSKDFINFPEVYPKEEEYGKLPIIKQPQFEKYDSAFKAIKKKDILLFYPYHSFDYFLNLLQEAAIDPNVKSIKVTLYRLAKESDVAKALINAASNGKKVTAVIELQARFDEVANIDWSRELSEKGVKVIYGVSGLKVHSKLFQAERFENNRLIRYCAVGTGNYNEDTAKIYTDHMLLTSDIKINNDVYKLFEFFKHNYKKLNYNHLLVSPFNLRNNIENMISNEIKNAKKGKEAFVYIKLNNLADPNIIELLEKAANAGVEVILLVRGMFSMKTDGKNIIARGIVDRFLEHTRILIFANGGDHKTYITSSDFMSRNLDRRVEAACPVYDDNLANELMDIFKINLNDNHKNRILDSDLSNKFYRNNKPEFNSQIEVHKYLKNKYGER